MRNREFVFTVVVESVGTDGFSVFMFIFGSVFLSTVFVFLT